MGCMRKERYTFKKCPMVFKFFRGLFMLRRELEEETRRRRERVEKDTSFFLIPQSLA